MNIRQLLYAATATAVIALAPAFAVAEPAALSESDMAEARGGLLVADGLAFQFGAVVKTFESGVLALQTEVTWTPEGVAQTQQTGAGVTPIAPPAGLAAGGAPAYYSQGGATFAHDVASGRILSVLMNTDSNRNFTQQTDVTIQLPGFEAVQGDMGQGLMALRLADEVSLGAIGALR